MFDTQTLGDEWGPEKIVYVADRRTGMEGILVIDNTARGMGKGGTRMSPSVTVREVVRLARTMTWKWAIADMFFGGAKAAIRADPNAPNRAEIIRAWARALAKHIPSEYVAGLDLGLSERDTGLIQDELGDRGAAVGVPSTLGGVPYDQLGFTGYGIAESVAVGAQFAGLQIDGARVAIQGFGAVGAAAAQRLAEMGARITAVSTLEGVIFAAEGLDVPQLLELRRQTGDELIESYGSPCSRLAPGAEVTAPVDILIPAAREDTIDRTLAADIAAKLIVEGANLAIKDDAVRALCARGVVVVPDFVANAGAAISTGVAMEQCRSAFAPDASAIYERVGAKIRENTYAVLERARREPATPREVALALAQTRVRAAMAARGRLPYEDVVDGVRRRPGRIMRDGLGIAR